ncbi:MAG: hypothetical protein JWM85_2380, partial [Acidimicrobiaceae bacterium]|nr:hypothetical protein [Acidimicrobiaceae bacterium]
MSETENGAAGAGAGTDMAQQSDLDF